MKLQHIIVASTIFFMTSIAQANDTAFGGSGASPMPIKKNTIAMVSENIHIIGHQLNRSDMRGAWNVNCEYNFQNHSKDSQSLTMGFPLPTYQEESDFSAPQGRDIKKGSPLVHDFVVKINGKKIASKRIKISANHDKGMYYEDAYSWHVDFKPQQKLQITHDYITGITHDSMGYIWVNYVLKTGSLWQGGVISSAKLSVVPNTRTRVCSEVASTPHDYMRPTPKGLVIKGRGIDRKYTWSLKNFSPKTDLSLCLVTGQSFIQHKVVYRILNMQSDPQAWKKLSKQNLQILRNTIFAQYGRTFKNKKLQYYFDQQWWYEKNPNYSDSLLNAEDKQAVSLISKFESKL